MQLGRRLPWFACLGFVVGGGVGWWLWYWYKRGKQFALRDRLVPADAIVVVAGTRGNLDFLHGKIKTAVKLFQKGYATYIIASGRFSVAVGGHPQQRISEDEIKEAVAQGRLSPGDLPVALSTWDCSLGAVYMGEMMRHLGVPADRILLECRSLNTKENAEYVLQLLEQYHLRRIILVSSPFHQLRSYLTFKKVLSPHGIDILNYHAETSEWHPAFWFLNPKNRSLVRSEIERIHRYLLLKPDQG
jgi:uncharacterized SAM-binding protein YcdF (DUF218 family)